MPVSELAPAIQHKLAFWAAMHIQEASSTDELQQIQGESVFRIFKTILHSLYPHIIFSNTENIDRSLPIAGNSPTAGNKRQDSHSHRMYVCSSYNYTEEKKYQSLSTLYSSRVGSWHSLLHCRTLASAKLENLCLFQALLVFFLGWSVYTQPSCTHTVLWGTVHPACWPCGLPGFMECQFSMFCENSYDRIHPTPSLYAGFGEPFNVE